MLFLSYNHNSVFLLILNIEKKMLLYLTRISPNARSLRHIFSGSYKNSEGNHVTGVYEILLKRASDSGSPGNYFSVLIIY